MMVLRRLALPRLQWLLYCVLGALCTPVADGLRDAKIEAHDGKMDVGPEKLLGVLLVGSGTLTFLGFYMKYNKETKHLFFLEGFRSQPRLSPQPGIDLGLHVAKCLVSMSEWQERRDWVDSTWWHFLIFTILILVLNAICLGISHCKVKEVPTALLGIVAGVGILASFVCLLAPCIAGFRNYYINKMYCPAMTKILNGADGPVELYKTSRGFCTVVGESRDHGP